MVTAGAPTIPRSRSRSIPGAGFGRSVVLLGFLTRAATAQTSATYSVPLEAINAGHDTNCGLLSRPTAPTGAEVPDTLIVGIFGADAKFEKYAKLQSDVVLLIGGIVRGEMKANDTLKTFALAPRELSGREIAIARADAKVPLCRLQPKPTPLTAIKIGEETTSFIADGSVSTSLRSPSATGASLTGALGIVHDSPKKGKQRSKWTKLLLTPTLDGEHLKAVIAIASTSDTLSSKKRAVFAQALFAPTFAGGQIGSAFVDYHPFVRRGGGTGTQGGRVNLGVSRSVWRALPKGGTSPADTVVGEVEVVSFDYKYRWAFVDRVDANSNNFAFAIELGAAYRAIGGADGRRRDFRRATIGAGASHYAGGTFAFDIQLRQVTAKLELPMLYFRAKDEDPDPGNLRGIQSVIGIRFDAPFFTF